MDINTAKKVAAKLLSNRSYTCREIIQKLILKGCDREVAEEVTEEFCRVGILNDEEYAFRYIHDGVLIGLKGMYRIKQELAVKGVAKSVIERACEKVEIDTSKQLEDYVKLRYEGKVFSDIRDIEKADILKSKYDKVIFATTTTVKEANKYNSNSVTEVYNSAVVTKLKELGISVDRGDVW